MASLFSAFFNPPSPPPPPPLPPLPALPSAAAEEAQADAVRRRRTRGATIATSPRGALNFGSLAPRRKRLLGE